MKRIMLNFPKSDTKAHALIIIGMAGSGKSTFVSSLKNHLLLSKDHKQIPYMINLDPAVSFVPFVPDLDIRTFHKHKEVMTKYKLGPNGAIMTCLNLFAADIGKMIDAIEKKVAENPSQLFIIDTPGQIEAFNWSASGQIIAAALAKTIPTSVLFVVDKPRCRNPNSFMSNMLFCISVLFRLKLPIMLIFNKADVEKDNQEVQNWLTDYDSFLKAISSRGTGYLGSLSRSLCLALDTFYKDLNYLFVSSITGAGFEELAPKFEKLRLEYFDVYYKDLLEKLDSLKVDADDEEEEKAEEKKEEKKEEKAEKKEEKTEEKAEEKKEEKAEEKVNEASEASKD